MYATQGVGVCWASDLAAAIELALYIRDMGYTPEQVQDFYPTPGSLSTTIYYTGVNPLTGKRVYVPKTPKEKNMQRALLQYALPENHSLVKEALLKSGREDLIGNGPKALIGWEPRKSFSKKTSKAIPNKASSMDSKRKQSSSHGKKAK